MAGDDLGAATAAAKGADIAIVFAELSTESEGMDLKTRAQSEGTEKAD